MSDLENNYYEDEEESIFDSDEDNKVKKETQKEELEYPLKNIWTIYDHTKGDSYNYEANTRCLGDIRSVVEFWQFFNNYCNPSFIFNNGVCKPTMGGKEISSVSFFKKGILPNWEDPINQKGAEVSKRKFNKHNPLSEVDSDWIELLMYCIGEQIDESVTGVRVVDSSSLSRNNSEYDNMDYKRMFRIELWFDNINKRQIIEDQFQNLLNLDTKGIYYKEHAPRE